MSMIRNVVLKASGLFTMYFSRRKSLEKIPYTFLRNKRNPENPQNPKNPMEIPKIQKKSPKPPKNPKNPKYLKKIPKTPEIHIKFRKSQGIPRIPK